jgi:hypothetical protein
MQIDESDEHFQNANSSIDKSLEPDSNVTVERDLHPEKQFRRTVTVEEGMQIARIPEFPVADNQQKYDRNPRLKKFLGKSLPEKVDLVRETFPFIICARIPLINCAGIPFIICGANFALAFRPSIVNHNL